MRKMLIGLLLIAAGSAHAGDGGDCGGNLIEYKPINAGGKQIGQVQLYYNSNTGMNCAVTYHGGDTWGVRSKTGASLYRCNGPSCGSGTTVADDYNAYLYQAGPVRADGAGKCMLAYGQINYKGTAYYVQTQPHCR